MLKNNCGCITVYPSDTAEVSRPQMSLVLVQAVGSMTFGADGIEANWVGADLMKSICCLDCWAESEAHDLQRLELMADAHYPNEYKRISTCSCCGQDFDRSLPHVAYLLLVAKDVCPEETWTSGVDAVGMITVGYACNTCKPPVLRYADNPEYNYRPFGW